MSESAPIAIHDEELEQRLKDVFVRAFEERRALGVDWRGSEGFRAGLLAVYLAGRNSVNGGAR